MNKICIWGILYFRIDLKNGDRSGVVLETKTKKFVKENIKTWVHKLGIKKYRSPKRMSLTFSYQNKSFGYQLTLLWRVSWRFSSCLSFLQFFQGAKRQFHSFSAGDGPVKKLPRKHRRTWHCCLHCQYENILVTLIFVSALPGCKWDHRRQSSRTRSFWLLFW